MTSPFEPEVSIQIVNRCISDVSEIWFINS
jgi:hypothetical protein